jgi:hypothetical protein
VHKVTGIIRYAPNRGNDFRKSFKARPVIVQFPYDDLTAFYRWLVKRRYHLDLQAPMFGNHVTIVRGDERPPKTKAWEKYEGHKLTVELSPRIYKAHHFWVLPVVSDRCYEIRRELGLYNFHNLHLTIGREFEKDRSRYWSTRQIDYLQEHDS